MSTNRIDKPGLDIKPVKEVEQEESFDTSDPVQVNTARKKSARTRADRLEFVHAAMTTPQGRAWFYDLIVRCHIFNRAFDPDPYIHAYKAGEVNIGLQILSDIQDGASDNYVLMIEENKRK